MKLYAMEEALNKDPKGPEEGSPLLLLSVREGRLAVLKV